MLSDGLLGMNMGSLVNEWSSGNGPGFYREMIWLLGQRGTQGHPQLQDW